MAGCVYFPKRYILVLLSHCGFFVVYALRVNLSVALVAMVNATYAHAESSSNDPECRGSGNFTAMPYKGGEFNWDQNHQGYILSSFFYGYILTQIPGGWWATKVGGKWVFGVGVLSTSILTLLTPLAAKASIYLFIAVRIVEGFGEGVTYPAMHVMLSKWCPPNERARMSQISSSGAMLGTVISIPVCGILANSNFLGGWPSTFYVFGVIGVVWFIVWIMCVTDSPELHSSISSEEKKYICDSLQECSSDTRHARIPWLRILTSIRVWAIIAAHFSQNWIVYLVLTALPSYFQEVLDFNLTKNGLISALPFLMSFATYIGGGALADYLRRWLNVTTIRRLMGILGFYTSSMFLVLASFAGCDQIGFSVMCMIFAMGFTGFNQSGFFVNSLDIAPRFAGVLLGITNTVGTISGCMVPLLTGYFTNDHPTRKNFRKVFLLVASIAVIGGTFYNIFVTGKQQQWNDLELPQQKPKGGDVHAYYNSNIESDETVENDTATNVKNIAVSKCL